MSNTPEEKFVGKDLYDSTNKTIFEKFGENDRRFDTIDQSIIGIKGDLATGFQGVFQAINQNKTSDLKGQNALYGAFFGMIVVLFGLIVYFGDLKIATVQEHFDGVEEVLTQRCATTREILEEKIKNAKLETQLRVHEKNLK